MATVPKPIGDSKTFILTQNEASIMHNDPEHKLSQVACFVETDSLGKPTAKITLLEGINEIDNQQITPYKLGNRSGVRIYFEVTDPAGRISEFQAEVTLRQEGATRIGDPEKTK